MDGYIDKTIYYNYSISVKVVQNNTRISQEGAAMKAEYDFSNAKKNPYAKKLKKQITINPDVSVKWC